MIPGSGGAKFSIDAFTHDCDLLFLTPGLLDCSRGLDSTFEIQLNLYMFYSFSSANALTEASKCYNC
jgi:hypothetical protein